MRGRLHFCFTFRLVLLLFVLLVLYHGRQVEIASSLDFLWKQQAKKELEEMSEMRRHTNQLLQNILPLHVAKYFLEQDRQAEVSTVRNSVEKRCDLKKKIFYRNCTLKVDPTLVSYSLPFPTSRISTRKTSTRESNVSACLTRSL